MAVAARPSDYILIGSKKEMTDYEIIESNVYTTALGLFDETIVNEWDIPKVCYWKDNTHYIVLKINKPVNIYRCGTKNWEYHIVKFIIYKLNEKNNAYEDITSSIEQFTSEITYNQWELTIKKLPKRVYKFQATGGRLDNEWFLEDVSTNSEKIKSSVKDKILNHKFIQKHAITFESEE